jgi:hypothetical protein
LTTKLIDPGDYTLKPAKTQAGGGGGGGDRDVLKASAGKIAEVLDAATDHAASRGDPESRSETGG